MAWSKEKLAALQEKYGGANAGAFHDPAHRRIAEKIFTEGRRPAPFAGVPTFLDAPLCSDITKIAGLDVALLGVPMDLGVTNRAGARFGPRALRAIERVGPYNDALGCAPLHEFAVADIGDVPMRSRFDLHTSLADIETHLGLIADAGVLPLSVGGDHSVTHPILKVLGRRAPVGLVHIDAHCDTAGPYEDEKFHHGGPFRNAVLDGVLDPERTIQIGIRGAAGYIWEFSKAAGMTVIEARDIADLGIAAIVARARAVVGEGPAYLSFDVDGLDPVYAPGTGTPEAGGLTMREALAILRGLAGLNFIGGDVVEVAPTYDPTSNTAQNGAQLLFEILTLLTFGPALAGRRRD